MRNFWNVSNLISKDGIVCCMSLKLRRKLSAKSWPVFVTAFIHFGSGSFILNGMAWMPWNWNQLNTHVSSYIVERLRAVRHLSVSITSIAMACGCGDGVLFAEHNKSD